MSSVNYGLKQKGVRLISSDVAWVKDKNGEYKLNPAYKFIGKVETSMPNVIMSASDKRKPKYKGDVCDLNSTAKKQLVDHFYDENGKRNKRTVAYLVTNKGGKRK